ncbi:Nn.00g111570.m01.CDS01 [Neocucurbitaria sp. VM-36]
MSVSLLAITTETQSSFQPFQCSVCQSRFTRHENLKRHAAVHSRSQDEASLSCDVCHATFSRPDLRLRHLKRKHPDYEVQRPRKRQAAAGVSDEERRQKRRTPSTSSTESRHDLHRQDSGDVGNVITIGENWHTVSPHNHRLQHNGLQDYQPESASLATRLLSQSVQDYARHSAADLAQHASMNRSTCNDKASQNATDLEPSSLLLASLIEPGEDSSTHIHPSTMSHTSFDTHLANFSFDQWSPDPLLSLNGLSQTEDDWHPSSSQIARGCELFFAHVSNFLPFLHQPTFDAVQVPRPLLLSMLCLAYQHGEDPDSGDEAGSGSRLSGRCFHRARALIAAEEEHADEVARGVTMVQTYLLLQVFAMMYSCDKDSAYGLKTHSKICALARASGLMLPIPCEATTAEDLDSLWRQFIQAESHKRTLFAVHQIDTLWYQFLSIPRSLSHLEIKQDLPCPEYYWMASSSGDWAHRQLVSRQSGPSIQYQDAVRRVLCSNSDLNSIPAFDPYGTINITQFLLSSAREISGWSTMTGMISMERLEPLRRSLLALSLLVHSQSKIAGTSHAVLCEATWEAAMIEVQLWSPAHTGGIVENSVDAALHQLIHLAPSCEFLCESNLAKSVQPHVDWFLRYLDETLSPDSEAPWVTLYACKAFMIAWQLVRGGVAGAMQAVGIGVGDMESALMWAKKVFRRRERWKVGKIVLACLDGLEI